MKNWDIFSKRIIVNQPILATIDGLVYSFLVICIGYYLLLKASATLKSIGFALIISSMPFSRIITPIFGGGDEVYVLNSFWNNHILAWIVSVVIVSLLAVPPFVKIWNTIKNKRKLLWMVGLIFVPFVMTGIVVFGILQSLLLGNGVFNEYWILGSPKLVNLVLFYVAV